MRLGGSRKTTVRVVTDPEGTPGFGDRKHRTVLPALALNHNSPGFAKGPELMPFGGRFLA